MYLRCLQNRSGQFLSDGRRKLRGEAWSPARDACLPRGENRGRTRHCLRTASWTTRARARRRPWSRASRVGCRHRSMNNQSRWRLACDRRNSCDKSLRYGVSPHPAQAPENSNSGCRNWTPRTLAKSTRARSLVGSVSKKAMLARSCSRIGAFGREVDCLDAGIARAVRRADLDADAAARAILKIELQREAHVGVAARINRGRFEADRSAVELVLVVVFGADDAVRAGEAALTALDAEIWLPHGYTIGDIALLECRGAGRVSPVIRNLAYPQFVTAAERASWP